MRNFVTVVVISVVYLIACGKKPDVRPEIVATVGDHTISYQNLEVSFMLDPRYAVRTPLRIARENQLEFLIDQEYYYRAAEASGLRSDSGVIGKLAYIEQQEILKAFIREQFLDSVRIEPDEVIEGLQRFSRILYVRNIFRKEQDDIRKIYKQIAQYPESVNEIFYTFGADLGWITFGMIDPALEKAAYGLDAGKYSDIIPTAGGYHLLLVEEIRINGDYQQVSQDMRIDQVQNALRKRKAHNGILEFLKQRAGSEMIQINNRVTGKVAAVIASDVDDANSDPTILQPLITRDELDLIEMDLLAVSGEPIARFGDTELSVREFLRRLKEMPPYHRPYLRGRARLVQVLLDMLRNDMLAAAANEQGYAMKASVRSEIEKFNREFLAGEFSKRYNNNEMRELYAAEWAEYDHALQMIRGTIPYNIYPDHLFTEGEDPDSILTDAPIPVFLKNRYIW